MKIETNKNQDCAFYIARVGSLAGKPLRKPYTSNNSFAVQSDNIEHDFAAATCLYLAGHYRPYTFGTCQVQIRIRDTRHIIAAASSLDVERVALLTSAIKHAEALEQALIKTQTLVKQLAVSVSRRS